MLNTFKVVELIRDLDFVKLMGTCPLGQPLVQEVLLHLSMSLAIAISIVCWMASINKGHHHDGHF